MATTASWSNFKVTLDYWLLFRCCKGHCRAVTSTFSNHKAVGMSHPNIENTRILLYAESSYF